MDDLDIEAAVELWHRQMAERLLREATAAPNFEEEPYRSASQQVTDNLNRAGDRARHRKVFPPHEY
jgi:hypothetical protein